MFLFYVPSFFKKGDTIQGGTLFKGGHYLRKYGMYIKNISYLWMWVHKAFFHRFLVLIQSTVLVQALEIVFPLWLMMNCLKTFCWFLFDWYLCTWYSPKGTVKLSKQSQCCDLTIFLVYIKKIKKLKCISVTILKWEWEQTESKQIGWLLA